MKLALLLAIFALAAVALAGCGKPEEGTISLKSSGFDRFKQPVAPRHDMTKPASPSLKKTRATTGRSGRS
jgi:hypothetical protein